MNAREHIREALQKADANPDLFQVRHGWDKDQQVYGWFLSARGTNEVFLGSAPHRITVEDVAMAVHQLTGEPQP